MFDSPRNAARIAVTTGNVLPVKEVVPPSADLFGKDVFGMNVMRECLPASVFSRIRQAATQGIPLSENDADVVASAMKNWAIERGATHYTHWFHPMTGSTAEKHDAFFTLKPDGTAINQFVGKMLIKGESDASSLPSGGIRSTFEARGYTAWDPTSPAFLMENSCGKTLYIPTVFFSYTGESLDRKAPLLRSIEAVSRQALRILRIFGNETATGVDVMVGSEQEYFLVDRRYFKLRLDLRLSGRTVYGSKPSKGQELEDHYYGAISQRVLAFMADVERKLLALGVPARTRHNEVAPGQFELAPMYESANLATDHNMITMEVLRSTAEQHGFACLLHEKPFAGINGSGKHNNWSLRDSEGNNLLDPGSTPEDNAQFLVFLAAIMQAVHKYAVVLRIGTVGAGNDLRLGANEAPPAIFSIFLGEQLTNLLNGIVAGKTEHSDWEGNTMEIGVSTMPPLPKDFSDRNRTSPFAFTGNKFEFRAVGASQSIAPANIAINAAVACALDDIATELEAAIAGGTYFNEAVQDILSAKFKKHLPVIFNGNGYTKEWEREAQRRGLPNLKDSVSTLAKYSDPEVMSVFLRHGILTERELLARQEILLETYIRAVHLETKLTATLGHSVILPAAISWLKENVELLASMKSIDSLADFLPEEKYYKKLRSLVNGLMKALEELDSKHAELDQMKGTLIRAEAARDELLPLMDECRRNADALEEIVDDLRWPLPKYNELLWHN